MKIYYFDPNNYGQQYFVMAESRSEAIKYLTKYFDEEIKKETDKDFVEILKEEKDVAINLKDDYTLEEFDVGEVIVTEIS